MQNTEKVKLALDYVFNNLPSNTPRAAWAVILGTGLSEAMDGVEVIHQIDFADIPGFPPATVTSHQGCFSLAKLRNTHVWLQCGRLHLYEGHSAGEVALPVRVLHGLGVRRLLLTNAAGSLNSTWEAGDLMLVADHINHTGHSPLMGPNAEAWGDRFPDMTAVYSPAMQHLLLDAAKRCGIRLRRGVYIGVHGPEMETPAETRMYKRLGADAIGMSTVLEVIAARHLDMETAVLSVLTNTNLPGNMAPASLEDIIVVAKAASRDLAHIILEVAPVLGAAGPLPQADSRG
ncbi:purine-nucleoside phosphorylase [Megalodesulfovibrio paquesii]